MVSEANIANRMTDKRNADIACYVRSKQAGMSFSAIRKELEAKGYADDEITAMIKEIDDRVIDFALTRTSGSKARELRIIGMLVMLEGGIVTIATYFGFIELTGYYILAWGPIVGGYLMILASRRIQRRGSKREKSSYFKR